MAKVLGLYKKPKSAEAFDKDYASVPIPLAKKIPDPKNATSARVPSARVPSERPPDQARFIWSRH
jgi:hypothetical protein